jgi:deoxyribodipyrimidine photo-lyase
MAQLRAIGWLPYRLRAMTTSYAVHDLGLPWPVVGRQLARLCLDYDPALLWPTVRRIAGVLDAAGPRIYNPDRQALALDPAGHYVRAWLPPLAAVPDSFVHNPWLMPAAMQAAAGCRVGVDVPAPIEPPRGMRAAGRAVRAPDAHRPGGEPDDRAADGPVQLPLVD